MQMTRKIAISGLLTALGVVTSTFYIPVGAAKCFPVQSMVNIIAGVMLGPVYAVGIAFVTSTLRILLGTGSLLAYPGSMIGALCCALLYKYSHKLLPACLGEVIGTGILGALAAYPIVTLILAKQAALFTYVIPFIISAVGGAAISVLLITLMRRAKVLDRLKAYTR
ncbi:energy coupling factor transporter S component ThiW [Sporobacter termitidis DSM 10068]|uniref:Energy coupling factor transporter S component ThiW n=1 Tax=Sporobacter termitidis DSM 10068 TaxID=1123282 RepID=A0A1M5XTC9_9FIRM|nr:energy coupling factor transporter S component ThiW [Sporobacter termitidis]SHI03060.1 energy coupling factor transporter S component ThiW [Sporobacter termitidis DSM 10068]